MKKKKIGFIIPLRAEAIFFLSNLSNIVETRISGRSIITGNLDSYEISIIISGCGKIKAASATQFLIDKFPCELYINFGTAGAISKDLKIGDIVVATEIIEHDVKEKFPEVLPPPVHHVSKNLIRKLQHENLEFVYGAIISGDEDIITVNRRNALFRKHQCLTVDWESAGFALTCQLSLVPYLVFRTVSDLAYEQTVHEYKKNQKKVIRHLTDEIIKSLMFA